MTPDEETFVEELRGRLSAAADWAQVDGPAPSVALIGVDGGDGGPSLARSLGLMVAAIVLVLALIGGVVWF